MRFSRDRRGYENTFVLHGERRRGQGRPRLLYWFRTPPEVKVGRAALDEEAIRLIEELNPDIEFDWTRILKGEGPAEPSGLERRAWDRPREGRRPDDARMRERGRVPREKGRQHPPEPAQRSPVPSAGESGSPAEQDIAAAPVVDTHETDELPAAPPTPAHARLGREGVERLRGRYAEIRTRIAERIADEARREELKSLAERLNPDSWVTDDEVRAGLEEYEGIFASLRAAVGDRRRRRRRRGQAREGSPRNDTSAAMTGASPADDAPGTQREPDVQLSETDADREDF